MAADGAMQAVICEYCDAVYRRTVLPRRMIARCEVCDGALYRTRANSVEAMLALSFAAVIAFSVAITQPLVTVVNNGSEAQATLFDAVVASFNNGVAGIAIIAATTLFLFPLAEISLYLYVLIPLRADRLPKRFVTAMHILRLLRPWSMVEVFMLGVVVAVIKLAAVVDVFPQPGVYGFGGLALIMVALGSFDRRELWDRADDIRSGAKA